ncbi:ribose 5-phosphate isomerase B [bacterium]|nr:ribose 5-phosphate isomerase B [bacterium]
MVVSTMIVAVGSDHAGYKLKEKIKTLLEDLHIPYKDFGTDSSDPCDYPEIGVEVAKAVSNSKCTYGIVTCGTGIGMDIVTNKIQGIRAALCTSVEMAEKSRRHNNANILVMGSWQTEWQEAKKIVQVFLNTEFESGGRHERRVNQIHTLTGI